MLVTHFPLDISASSGGRVPDGVTDAGVFVDDAVVSIVMVTDGVLATKGCPKRRSVSHTHHIAGNIGRM